MNVLAPLALLFGLSLPAIVLLHLRQARLRRLRVTTLRFWEEATRAQPRQPARRRPPRSRLLLVQLAIAGLLTLALARLALPWRGLPGAGPPRQLIVVLDRSLAMRATDVTPTRFAVARDRALDLVRAAAPDEAVALLTLGNDPLFIRSRDRADRQALLDRLGTLEPTGGPAEFDDLAPLLRATLAPGRENAIVVLWGGTPVAPPDRQALATLPATMRWVRVGDPTANVAITRLVARPTPQVSSQFELFASVANFSDRPVVTSGRVEANGAPVDQRTIALPARGTVDLVWRLPPDTRDARFKLDGHDGLALDDEAWVILRAASQTRVLLVTANAGDLGRALAAQPGVTLTTVAPEAYQPDAPYDLTVFDGAVPATLPPGGVLLVNPPPSNPLVPATGDVATPVVARVDAASPLLTGVDLSGVTFTRQPAFARPAWAREVVGGPAGALVLTGQVEGHAVVVLAFDLAASSLPRKLAFPLLIGNIVTQTRTHHVPTAAPLGQPFTVAPVAGTSSLRLRDPTGATRDVALTIAAGGTPSARLALTVPGRYTLIERDRQGTVLQEEAFAVNAGDPVASNLQQPSVALPTGQGGLAPGTSATAEQDLAGRWSEFWPVALVLGLALLVLEWWLGLGAPAAPARAPERVAPPAGLVAPARQTRGR